MPDLSFFFPDKFVENPLIPGRMSFAKQTEDEVESPGAKSEKSDKSEDDSQLRIAPFHHLFQFGWLNSLSYG